MPAPDNFNWLEDIGVRIPALFAGLAGGIVGAWADSKVTWKQWLIYAACGAITANFLAEPATHIIPLVNEGSAGFMVGCAALAIVKAIILAGSTAVQKWSPGKGGPSV